MAFANGELAAFRLRLLKACLFAGAAAWGVSFSGVFLPWPQVSALLNGLGLENVPDAPLFIYWFRMTAGAFGFIGVLFLILALNPERRRGLVSIAGCFMLFEGLSLLAHGALLKLSPLPFYFDCGFCLAAGTMILVLNQGPAEKNGG